MYKIRLIDDAKTDIADARLYYDSLVKGLGERFKLDFKKIVIHLEANPHVYGFRFNEFRTANLQIFPYQVHYKIEEGSHTVIIFAVLHGYRDPGFIAKRNI